MAAQNTGQTDQNRFGDVARPRTLVRRLLHTFYRMDHVYSVIGEFKNTYKGPFSILEFGVADGYAFTKKLFATRYLEMEDEVIVHGFDSFEGMPETDDTRDKSSIVGADWKAGQFAGSYEGLRDYCTAKYRNWRLHKGYFENTLTPELLEEFRQHKPMLVWIDCDYYTSARAVMERLIPYLPTGCVVYFDEFEFNFGSRFTGEARLVHEINTGQFGDGIELVLDRELSMDLSRCYRFINVNATTMLERQRELEQAGFVHKRGNDSPLP
jgi:hypothetical protein